MLVMIMKPVALVLLLVGVVSIFLSRDLVRINIDIEKENKVSESIRLGGYIVSIISLITLYFLVR